MGFTLFSSAFAPHSHIPSQYTCDGGDVSPPLEWTGAPVGVMSFALIASDPDAPKGVWYHWSVFDIPPWYVELPEAFPPETDDEDAPAPPDGIRQARNSFGDARWNGPCPPHYHHVKHHYRFHLMALDVERLSLPPGVGARKLERACEGHILDEAQLTGIYKR